VSYFNTIVDALKHHDAAKKNHFLAVFVLFSFTNIYELSINS